MTPDQITDEASLKAWLEGQTRAVAVTIAHRAAMRVAPMFWTRVPPVSRDLDLTATVVARSLLIAGVAGTCPTPAITEASAASTASAAASTASAASAAASAASAAAAAASAYAASAASAASTASAAASAYAAAAAAGWTSLREDAKTLADAETGQPAAATPLWHDSENPRPDDWRTVRTGWAATDDPGWQFWIDWYVAALDGKPLLGAWDRHWALLTDIALIAPADWDAGADTVNPPVAQKYEIHGLRAEADRLKRDLQRAEATAATAAHRSHNQPPDLVETPSVQQYRVALKALDDAETELAKPYPSSSRLRSIANVLLDWTKGVAAYCVELGDVALKEVAKGIGKAAVPGTALFLAAQSEQVRQFANALLDLSSRLP